MPAESQCSACFGDLGVFPAHDLQVTVPDRASMSAVKFALHEPDFQRLFVLSKVIYGSSG
jgi:hypothetical protein